MPGETEPRAALQRPAFARTLGSKCRGLRV